jgi:hypothetical protein
MHLHTRLIKTAGGVWGQDEFPRTRGLVGSGHCISWNNMNSAFLKTISLSFRDKPSHLHDCFEVCIFVSNHLKNEEFHIKTEEQTYKHLQSE